MDTGKEENFGGTVFDFVEWNISAKCHDERWTKLNQEQKKHLIARTLTGIIFEGKSLGITIGEITSLILDKIATLEKEAKYHDKKNLR